MTTQSVTPAPVLDETALYLCDNGACDCGAHAGMTARFTGRDRSGQPVERVSAAECREYGFACESCGRTAR